MNTKIAYCGLACIACCQKDTCSGRREEGCMEKAGAKIISLPTKFQSRKI